MSLSNKSDHINYPASIADNHLDKYSGSMSSSYRGLTLRSVFQPIFSIAHRRAVGYEGLIRPENSAGEAFPIDTLFSLPESTKESLELDRLCRRLHIKNFATQDTSDEWLFINLNSQCLETERPSVGFMNTLFSVSGIKPYRVVIEILESEIKDRVYLKQLVEHFRAMGCLIAIDDFGAGHSNFDRIWEIEPDIVKIDRNLIKHASGNPKIKRILSGMISLIHETGCLVIIEGIETKQEAMIAIESSADMVQGFYFARPHEKIELYNTVDLTMGSLIQLQTRQLRQLTIELDQHFKRFVTLFDDALDLFKEKTEMVDCAKIIFREDKAIRCFLLDYTGYQIGNTLHSTKYQKEFTKSLTPLLSGHHACWSHKHYHYRAINNPGKVQLTQPYLSVAGKHMCVTVSKTVEVEGQIFVFCCDLDWQGNE